MVQAKLCLGYMNIQPLHSLYTTIAQLRKYLTGTLADIKKGIKMSYKLEKPYMDKQRADFVCEYQGLQSYETDDAFYFLAENEKVDESGNILLNQNYQKEQRLKEIEIELVKIKLNYETALDTPIIYEVNGFTYKPSYAKDDYESLLNSYELLNLTDIEIEDSTHLEQNTLRMTKDELIALSKFLKQKQIESRNVYSASRAALLKEKEDLKNQIA